MTLGRLDGPKKSGEDRLSAHGFRTVRDAASDRPTLPSPMTLPPNRIPPRSLPKPRAAMLLAGLALLRHDALAQGCVTPWPQCASYCTQNGYAHSVGIGQTLTVGVDFAAWGSCSRSWYILFGGFQRPSPLLIPFPMACGSGCHVMNGATLLTLSHLYTFTVPNNAQFIGTRAYFQAGCLYATCVTTHYPAEILVVP